MTPIDAQRMPDETLPGTPRGRLRWALREGAVVAGVLLFWLAAAAALTLGLSLVSLLIRAFHLGPLYLVADLFRRTAVLWPAFSAVAFATVALYVVVRAGTLLIDHSRSTAG